MQSVILMGGPDSGKTNYIGRLWCALDACEGALRAATQPEDLRFVLDVAAHLHAGSFAPRSENTHARRTFEVKVTDVSGSLETNLMIPDVYGEMWRDAVLNSEIAPEWMDEMCGASGALLFVRVHSDQDVRPLDWVASHRMLKRLGNEEVTLPTQVMLCELLRFLELSLVRRLDGAKPRVAIVVSAWDLVDAETFARGPTAYLQKEYPLFAGRLADTDTVDVQVFGLSVVGGDLRGDALHRDSVLDDGLDSHGWAVAKTEGEDWTKSADLTLPLAWAVGL